MKSFTPNTSKSLVRSVDHQDYARIPVRTHVITTRDTIEAVVDRYAKPYVQTGDVLCVSERIVAITQGRAWPIDEIKPSRLARILVRFVHKSSYGIGLGSPWTMELAVREVGVMRIVWAAVCSALTKPFGVRGVFYKVVGHHISAIDGPCDYTLPPFNRYAKLGPRDPDGVARALAKRLGIAVVIIDANDLGVSVLGRSFGAPPAVWIEAVLKDNPLGQSREQTPMAIVRKC